MLKRMMYYVCGGWAQGIKIHRPIALNRHPERNEGSVLDGLRPTLKNLGG
jgi:hypothetical protein